MSQLFRHVSGSAYRSTQAVLVRMLHGHRNPQDAVIHIPRSDVFHFGDSNRASPVFEGLEWTINEGENWAVLGSGRGGQKTALLQVRKTLPMSHLKT